MTSCTSLIILSAATLVLAWDPFKYAFDPRIHNLGNHGLKGKLHAEIAPIFTKAVDDGVYGANIRKLVVDRQGENKRILDLGCGTGFSTSAGEGCVGIDLSEPMIEKARVLFPNKRFELGDMETWDDGSDYDIVTCMFCFHETPAFARKRIIDHMLAIASEKVVVVDIAPEYKPSKLMLSGEPYLEDYLANVREDMADFKEDVLVGGHVHMWSYDLSMANGHRSVTISQN